tara:strand:+ start:343 stop:792 length:450 start_codon:yes stop_codon:yes gene_type:complete
MESVNSSPPEQKVDTPDNPSKEEWVSDRFETLLPHIQERWPDMAKQTLEATKGSLDELVRVISLHSGKTSYGVKEQLEELFNSASDRTKDLADNLEPLEKQLENLLDDLNSSLRPRIEKPVRARPLLALGIATSIGILLGIIISGGKKS